LKICEEHSRNFERIVSNIEKDYAKGSEKQGLKFDELEDQITRERLAHTKEIQQKIALVGEMMKDCAETVHQQGEDLDRIDLEVNRANKYTAKADVELEKTDLRQRRKKCFCWSIMIASAGFVVALVIVVVLMTKK
jgi:t-SNARE complex subunit (syntaxin)